MPTLLLIGDKILLLTFRYGSKVIEVIADIKNNSTSPSCNSVFISRQQLSKAMKNDEIFAVHLNTIEGTDESSLQSSEVRKILKEYQDVFPKALPNNLPPKRTVDHAIELVPGSEPPHRSVYRMS